MDLKVIKSASIILQRTSGEVFMAKRSDKVSFFPGFWVFPGGKLEEKIDDEWRGDEPEAYETVFQEMYEEIGIIPGMSRTIDPNDRDGQYFDYAFDYDVFNDFKESLIFIGRKRTPPFSTRIYDAAYFLSTHNTIENFDPKVDEEELVSSQWILPKTAIEEWENGNRLLPPPILHLLRNLKSDNPVSKTLVETDLPIGLQTKIEIAPGFQIIPIRSNTIDPFTNTNLIIIEDEDERLLVDPGANEEGQSHLKEIAYRQSNVSGVLITHHHRDHWQGLEIIEELMPQITVFAHPKTIDRIETNLETEEIIEGELNVGSKILKVIKTPGHTDGHISLFDETQNLLIAGDHVVGKGSAVLDPKNGDMKEYFETTRKLIDLDPDYILPGHGPPNFDGTALLRKYLSHRQKREDDILAAIENGHTTPDQIVEQVYQDVPEKMWEYAKRNIELHIEKLEKENRMPS